MDVIAQLERAVSCPNCSGRGYRSFTFYDGETITLCPECQYESGHEALLGRKVRCGRRSRRHSFLFPSDPRETFYWQGQLVAHRLAVIDSRQIGTIRMVDNGRRIVVYKRDEKTGVLIRHGSEIGVGLLLPSKKTRKNPSCLHPAFWDVEGPPLKFVRCSDCDHWLFLSDVFYRPTVERIFGDGQLWKDRQAKRHNPNPIPDDDSDDGRDFKSEDAGLEFLWFPRGRATRPMVLDRGKNWSARVAPEIDQRRREAVFRYRLQHPPYRAPHKKVLELRDAGFSIDQIARKLKVSPSTIDNRLRDAPYTVPGPELLALRVKAGGGYARPRFWPSADNIPRLQRVPLAELPWHYARAYLRDLPLIQPKVPAPEPYRDAKLYIADDYETQQKVRAALRQAEKFKIHRGWKRKDFSLPVGRKCLHGIYDAAVCALCVPVVCRLQSARMTAGMGN